LEIKNVGEAKSNSIGDSVEGFEGKETVFLALEQIYMTSRVSSSHAPLLQQEMVPWH